MSAPGGAPQLPNLASTRLSGDSVPSSAPGSPPYEHAAQAQQGFGMLPPHYASRPDVNVPLTADEKGKRATPPSSASQSSGSAGNGIGTGTGSGSASVDPAAQPGRAFRSQGQRIAVTDPLADMRARNLSRPEGLGARSDYPANTQRSGLPNVHPDAAAAAKAGGGVSAGGFVRPAYARQNSNASSLDDDEHAGYDDFDWSDDENVEEQARFEEEQNENPDLLKKRSGRLAPSKIIRWLATTFLGNLIVSCSLIVPVVVMQFVYRPRADATDAAAARRDFIADNIQAWFIWAAFNLHIMWWLHIMVELVPPVVMGIVRLLWGGVSQRVLTMAEWFNAIKGCIKPVFYAAMSWGSWAIIFNSIYDLYTRTDPANNSRAKYLYRIYQVVEFFFFFTLTICVEQVLIKIIAMRFHKSSFAERIAEVTKALSTFDRLKDYRPRVGGTGTATPTHARGYSAFGIRAQTPRSAGYPPQDMAYMADSEGHGSSTASPQRKTGGFFKRHAAKRPSPDDAAGAMPARAAGTGAAPNTPGGTINSNAGSTAGRAARGAAATASSLARAAMNDPFNLLTNQGLGLSADVNNPREAKRLARTIFVSFRGQHKRSYLVPTDFEVAFPTPAEAKEAFAVFDRDGNGDISATEIKTTVLSTYKERRFLSKSMQDVHHAVNQLDRILLFVAFIVIIFEALAIFDIDLGKTLTTFYTLAIAFAFIFKESAQAIWDSIIFIFVTHPFDTGDRICLAEDVMTVKKMSLLSSEFVLWNGTSLFISNDLLSKMFIVNYRRSGYQWESVALQIAFDTPLAKLDAAQADLIHWMQTEPERMFEPSTAIVPQSIDYMRSIEVTIGMTPRQNWQDWGGRFYKRNAFFAAICYYMKKHGVHYAASNQPIVYWTDDAAQLPPSYDGNAPPPSATRDARRPSAASDAYEEESAFPVDDFRPSPPSSPVLPARDDGTASGATTPRPPQPKPKSFMNFTPPPDEIEGSGLRLRKARPKRHAYNLQGGDG